MDFVYKKAERQTRISAELQEKFKSDEEYVDTNSGGKIGGRGESMGKFKKRHTTRTKAYTPQGMPFDVLPTRAVISSLLIMMIGSHYPNKKR